MQGFFVVSIQKILAFFISYSTNEHLNPEMERALVEGTVKEAWGRRFKISTANHKRDRVPVEIFFIEPTVF